MLPFLPNKVNGLLIGDGTKKNIFLKTCGKVFNEGRIWATTRLVERLYMGQNDDVTKGNVT